MIMYDQFAFPNFKRIRDNLYTVGFNLPVTLPQ